MNRKDFLARYNKMTGLLLHKITDGSQYKNIAISPFSVFSLLSLLSDATDGKTREEILNLLYDVNASCRQGLPEQLKSVHEQLVRVTDTCDEDPDFKGASSGELLRGADKLLNIANVLLVKDEYKGSVNFGFIEHLRDYYNGEVFFPRYIFSKHVNWADDLLDDMFPMFHDFMYDDDLVLALINYIRFEAIWADPYEEESIRKGIFHNADHTNSTVFMLHDGADYYVENDIATGFIKYFRHGDYSFVALLPKEEGQKALQRVMEETDFADLLKQKRFAIVHSVMPEFHFSFQTELNEIARSLGIMKAFTQQADFSPVSSIPLMVDRMIHGTEIEVNRFGVRAVAATAVAMGIGACLPEDEKTVILDRPFVFAIVNEGLGIPVFVGCVNHIESVAPIVIQYGSVKNCFDRFQRACIMRCVPFRELDKYLDEILEKGKLKDPERLIQLSEIIRDHYPIRKRRIHLLQASDVGAFSGDKVLEEALKAGRLEKAEEEAEEDPDCGYDPCSCDELDKYIEQLIEVRRNPERKEIDIVDAYVWLETEAEGDPDRMPDGIGVVEFMEAWNKYVEKNPVRKKVMFTWDDFFALPEDLQKAVALGWDSDEVEYWDAYDMYEWLKDYGSPHARKLEPGDEMLEEYRGKGRVQQCPVCGGKVMAYGSSSAYLGEKLAVICSKCGLVGQYSTAEED